MGSQRWERAVRRITRVLQSNRRHVEEKEAQENAYLEKIWRQRRSLWICKHWTTGRSISGDGDEGLIRNDDRPQLRRASEVQRQRWRWWYDCQWRSPPSPTAKLRFNRRKDLQLAYEVVGLRHQETSGKFYRVAHLLWERNMLTSISKFRQRPKSQDKFTAKRNFKFGVNISFSRSRWATLYVS